MGVRYEGLFVAATLAGGFRHAGMSDEVVMREAERIATSAGPRGALEQGGCR